MASARKGSIELIKVAGVQVEIDYSWIFIAVLVWWSLSAGYFPREYPGHSFGSYWTVGAIGTVLFFASVLGHELSHAEAVFVRTGLWHNQVTWETNALRDCLYASALPRHLGTNWFARKQGARPIERRR